MLSCVLVGKHTVSCWSIVNTIVLSSPIEDPYKKVETQIINVDIDLDKVIVDSAIVAYFIHTTLQTNLDYAIEVATLYRLIILMLVMTMK